MARTFTKNTSNYLSLGTNGINSLVSGSSAITLSAWVKFASIDSTDGGNRVVTDLVTGVSSVGIYLGTTASPFKLKVGARSTSADSLQSSNGTTTLSTGVWLHLAGVIDFAGGTIQPYLNGVAEGGGSVTFGASSYSPSGVTGFAYIGNTGGANPYGAGTTFMVDGDIAEVAVWKGKLTAGEIAGLARGVSAVRVRPSSLVLCMPLYGAGSTPANLVGPSPVGTITGSIPAAAHAPVAAPFGGIDWPPYAVAATPISSSDSWGWTDGTKATTVSDDFSGTSGTNLTTYNPTWFYHPSYTGSSLLISNAGRVRPNSANENVALYDYAFTSGDYDVSADLTMFSGIRPTGGVVGRFDSTANTGYRAVYDDFEGNVTVTKAVAGTVTTIGSAAYSTASTSTLTLRMRGSTISILRNGTQIGSWTDSSVSGPGRAGILAKFASTDTSQMHLDNFVATGGSVGPERILGWTTDVWGWSEQLKPIVATTYAGDSFGWTESLTPTASVAGRDAWGWTDTRSILAGFATGDSWAFLDASDVSVAASLVTIIGSDSWSFSDGSNQGVSVAGSDSFGWSDAATPSATLSGSDAWTFLDRPAIEAALAAGDVWYGAETARPTVLVTGSDSWLLIDGATVGILIRDGDSWAWSERSADIGATLCLGDSWGWAERLGTIAATTFGADSWGWDETASALVQRIGTDAWTYSDQAAVQALAAGTVYHVYGNDGAGGAIDYATPLATVSGLSWTSGALAYPGEWKFAVRAYDNINDLEELNLDAAVDLILDSSGVDITARPVAPQGLTATPIAAGTIRLTWTFTVGDGGTPTGFKVYRGVGSVSYGSPVATVAYSGAGSYQATITGGVDGTTYRFGVRAYNATSEEDNTAYAEATADATGPPAVDSLSATGVES